MKNARPTPEELRHLYVFEGLRLRQIAEHFGVSKQAVSLWLKGAGIKARPGPGTRIDLPLEDLIRLNRSGFTDVAIAARYHVGTQTVAKRFHDAGYSPIRHTAPQPKGAASRQWRGADATYGAMQKRVQRARGTPSECEDCGVVSPRLTYDWVCAGDRTNVNEYIRLCRRCRIQGQRQKAVTLLSPRASTNGNQRTA